MAELSDTDVNPFGHMRESLDGNIAIGMDSGDGEGTLESVLHLGKFVFLDIDLVSWLISKTSFHSQRCFKGVR